MSCDCSETGVGNTQSTLVAWVQPNGAGPQSPVYYAMDDLDWPGIKITGVRTNRRGAITPIYMRSGRNPQKSVRRGSRTAAPAANTITLEFANGGCGGFQPSELVQCLLDVYQQYLCCSDGGDFVAGWSKIDIFSGIDIESDEYSDGASYNSEDNVSLFIRHTAELRSKLTVYPLTVSEVALAGGFDTGSAVIDVIYANKESCSNGCGPQLGCADRWYALTNEGTVIYKKNAPAAITSAAIAGYPTGSNVGTLAILGSKLFATYVAGDGTGGYYWTTLDSTGAPGTWTQVAVSAFQPNGWVDTSSSLLLYGQAGSSAVRVYEVNNAATATLLFAPGTANTGLTDMARCGQTSIGVGINGTIWLGGCNNSWSLASSTPTASTLRAVDVRVAGEWWVGGDSARVYYTTDSGQTWTEVSFDFSGAGLITDIVWANPNVGYVLYRDAGGVPFIYTTWNGGQTWINGKLANDRMTVPTNPSYFDRMAIPCCTNQIEQSNNFLISGFAGADGSLYQGQIRNC